LARDGHAAGLSQEEPAGRAAIHRTQVKFVERSAGPGAGRACQAREALETSLESLVDGISWTPTVTKSGEFNVTEPPK
jgi:hypothetical protein